MRKIGIEAINAYGSSLFLDQTKLAGARGRDPEKVVRDFLIETRALNPPWEDTITMGANAAKPLLEYVSPEDIGMLIVGTEGSLDFGKPVSTNIHGALGLPPNIRNYETKHACYSGVAALDTAINWIAAGLNHGKKALIISTDFSRMHLDAKEEFVLGGVAVAAVVGDEPKVVEYELQKRGSWTTDAYDTFRPSAHAEVGNNEVSLYTYMDAIEGSYEDYLAKVGEIDGKQVDFDEDFDRLIYHTPFPGMAFQAHRTLCNLARRRSKAEVREDFERRVLPALAIARRVGSTYGASNFVGLCSMLLEDEKHGETNEVKPGSKAGFFAYGSGAIGEFYSGTVCPGAHGVVRRMGIPEALDRRREVSVEEYEAIEKLRESYIENPDFTPDFSVLDNWYEEHYRGNGYLVLEKVESYYRTYAWS